MRRTLLLTAMLIASVFTAKAQTEFSTSVEAYPNTSWEAAWAVYDMTNVASALGYATPQDFHDDLLAACQSKGSEGTLAIYNIDNNGNETLATGAANYWHTEDGGENWVNFTYGCFWLNDNSESVEWDQGNKFWTHVDWYLDDNQLVIGMGQMAYENGGTGLAPNTSWTSHTKLVHGSKYVILRSTLIIIEVPPLPTPVVDLNSLTIVDEFKVEVTQQVMTEWDSDGTKNPQWAISGKALLDATGADPNAVASGISTIFYMRAWDNASDMLSDVLTANHTANGNGFWCARTIDPDTEEYTDYCVQGEYGGSDFFVENIAFWTSDSTFHGGSGQMINRFKGGEHFYTDLYFIIGDKAIHVEFHFNVESEREYTFDEMEKVGEITMNWTQEPRTTTDGLKKWIPNYDEVLEALGCTAAQVRFKLLQPDNSIVSETNTGNNGFWVDGAGYKTETAEDKLAFYVDYVSDVMAFNVGQYANVAVAGDELVAAIMLCNKEKYYLVNVILTIEGQTKADPADYYEVGNYKFDLRTLIDDTWNCTEHQTEPLDMADVADILETEDFVVYAKVGDEWTKGYTCTPYPGFWYTPEGAIVGWSDAHIGMVFERNYLLTFKNPQQTDWTLGNTFTHDIYLVNEVTGAYITLTVKMTVVDEIVDYETVGEDAFTVNVDPAIDSGYAMEAYDATEMFSALGITADDFWNGDVMVMEQDGDDYVMMNEPGLYEYFFDTVGNAVASDGSTYSFLTVFEQGDDNKINITGYIADLNPEDVSGQERSTVFCIQKGAKRFFFTLRLFFGLEDSIQSLVANGKKDGRIFNLQGQRVSTPARGLYIIDGKKVFVK